MLTKQHEMEEHIVETYVNIADLITKGFLILSGINVYFFYLHILIIFFSSYTHSQTGL